MDTPAYSLPIVHQITQLLSTSRSVITLGQLSIVPLMCRPSELSYGLEPHSYILLSAGAAAVLGAAAAAVEVYPRWLRRVDTGGVLYRVLTTRRPEASFDAYLMNIKYISVHTAV